VFEILLTDSVVIFATFHDFFLNILFDGFCMVRPYTFAIQKSRFQV